MVVLSIVIPCYNEEKRLAATLRDIAVYVVRAELFVEVIVVDDGSHDQTSLVARSMIEIMPYLRVLRYDRNRGKGYAVRSGVFAATGDYVLFMDADNATSLSELEKLWPYIHSHEVVIGSRYREGSVITQHQPWYRVAMSRVGNALIRALAVSGVRDTQCGFKLFQRNAAVEIFARQHTEGFGFDIEILAIAQRVLHYDVQEVAIAWHDAAESKVRPIRDSWRTFRELLHVSTALFAGGYANPWKFVGHRM